MYGEKMKPFWIGAAVFGLLFGILFSIRLGLFDRMFTRSGSLPVSPPESSAERDAWMNIFQNNRKIGSSHSTFSQTATGYRIEENIFMRVNTMGLVQDIHLKTEGNLKRDYSLSSFDFEINSGRFKFSAKGSVSGDVLSMETRDLEATRRFEIALKEKVYIVPSLMHAIAASEIKPGEEYSFEIFDPATMGQETVNIRVLGHEDIINMGRTKKAIKISLMFKGFVQQAWIDPNGEVLQETGLLGIRLERTTRDEALYGLPVKSSEDLTTVASIPSNVSIDDTQALERLVVEIENIVFENFDLEGGRQTLKHNVLTIVKESLADIPLAFEMNNVPQDEKNFLNPTPFVQSDHPKIQELAKQIVATEVQPLKKIQNLLEWIQNNIERRPVLSLPDAISTLENRMGDCNEHAVLLAAFSRACGIPAKIEAGLVYLNGRFYYHAWNLLYLGKWITVDSLFGQIPADVTHIRFSSGGQKQQINLMGMIGKIKLTVIEPSKPTP